MCFGENTHYREQKFKAAACAEHSNHFRAASSLSVQLKPMNVSSWLKCFSYKPFTVQTRDKLPHPKILLGLLWKGSGRRGPLGEGTSPRPLHKQRGAGLTAAGAGAGWEQQTRPLQPGRSEALPRWGRGSEVPGQAQAQLKHGSGRPALKAAPRGKGGKASHRFPTKSDPRLHSSTISELGWTLGAISSEEKGAGEIFGALRLLQAGMKNDEIFCEDW